MARWLFTFLVLLLPLASAASDCVTTLQNLGAEQSSWDKDEYPALWSIKLADLLPLLSAIDGIRDLSPASFARSPLEAVDLTYKIGAACFGHYLFLNKGTDYLVTIDLKQKKKLSGVQVVGIPTRVWHVSGSVYAINLFTGLEPQSAVLDIKIGAVYFNPGPGKFGGETTALVVPDRAVLIQSYNWGAPSASNLISLFLFNLQDGVKPRTLEMMPACTVQLPKGLNPYKLRYLLLKAGIVMRGTTDDGKTVSKHLTRCANLVTLLNRESPAQTRPR